MFAWGNCCLMVVLFRNLRSEGITRRLHFTREQKSTNRLATLNSSISKLFRHHSSFLTFVSTFFAPPCLSSPSLFCSSTPPFPQKYPFSSDYLHPTQTRTCRPVYSYLNSYRGDARDCDNHTFSTNLHSPPVYSTFKIIVEHLVLRLW